MLPRTHRTMDLALGLSAAIRTHVVTPRAEAHAPLRVRNVGPIPQPRESFMVRGEVGSSEHHKHVFLFSIACTSPFLCTRLGRWTLFCGDQHGVVDAVIPWPDPHGFPSAFRSTWDVHTHRTPQLKYAAGSLQKVSLSATERLSASPPPQPCDGGCAGA